jgi:hypothetical protein
LGDTFHLFHLSLSPRDGRQLELWTDDETPSVPPTREAFLRQVFGRPMEFQHRNNTFYYVPVSEDPSGALIGRIGREFESEENLAPEHKFESVTRPGWKAAVVAVNPIHLDDGQGQKVAVHHHRTVGRPFSVLASLVRHINETGERTAAYHIEVAPIFDSSTFWTFAERNRGDITVLTFDLATPNPLDGKDAIEQELKAYHEATQATSVAISLKGEDGLQTDSATVREAVEYAQRGAGKITAKTRDNVRYDSTKSAATVRLERPPGGDPLLVRAAQQIGRLLGKLK